MSRWECKAIQSWDGGDTPVPGSWCRRVPLPLPISKPHVTSWTETEAALPPCPLGPSTPHRLLAFFPQRLDPEPHLHVA